MSGEITPALLRWAEGEGVRVAHEFMAKSSCEADSPAAFFARRCESHRLPNRLRTIAEPVFLAHVAELEGGAHG
jgi:hypothetical protein